MARDESPSGLYQRAPAQRMIRLRRLRRRLIRTLPIRSTSAMPRARRRAGRQHLRSAAAGIRASLPRRSRSRAVPEPKPQGRNRPSGRHDRSQPAVDRPRRPALLGRQAGRDPPPPLDVAGTDRRRQHRRGVRGDRRDRRRRSRAPSAARDWACRLGWSASACTLPERHCRGIVPTSRPDATSSAQRRSLPVGGGIARGTCTDKPMAVSAPRAHAHHEIVEAHLGDLSPEIGIAAERHEAVDIFLNIGLVFDSSA